MNLIQLPILQKFLINPWAKLLYFLNRVYQNESELYELQLYMFNFSILTILESFSNKKH